MFRSFQHYERANDTLMLFTQRFYRELAIWQHLRHSNILHLLGIETETSPVPCIVSPLMKHGPLNRYIKEHAISPPAINALVIEACFAL